MKLALFATSAALLLLIFFTYRSRVRSTFKLLSLAYGVLIIINIVRAGSDENAAGTVIPVLALLAAIWAISWGAVSLSTRQRQQRARSKHEAHNE